MYHPYFRGKTYELVTIRENAILLATSKFVPIIEPVKEGLNGLQRALSAVCEAGGNAIVIINPFHGEYSEDGADISTLLKKGFLENKAISAGILLKKNMGVEEVVAFCEKHKHHNPSLIHAGFPEPKALASQLTSDLNISKHIFFDQHCGKLYRRHFIGVQRILIRDGFKRRRNADHPDLEEFSDLHVTYQEEDMNGFGDFLIVGDEYSEGGGPAYAVAIHLTFIDSAKEDIMYIHHYVSEKKDTPTDPGGKFAQALEKLIFGLNSGYSNLLESNAIQEFRELHKKGHFPGLGYVKKLSMQHHIETLADFLGK
jgi:hypothetical protein